MHRHHAHNPQDGAGAAAAGGSAAQRFMKALPTVSVGEWTESSRDLREGLMVIEHGSQRDWNDYAFPNLTASEDWSKLSHVR